MILDRRYVTSLAAILLMEGCWLYALLAVVNREAADGRLSVWGLMLLYPVSLGINALLRRARWPRFLQRGTGWLAWAILMLVTVKLQLFSGTAWADTAWLLAIPRALADIFYNFDPSLWILISSPVLWWLGQRLSGLKPGFTLLVGEFQFGLALLVGGLLIASTRGENLPFAVLLVMIYFAVSLLGISAAHGPGRKGFLSRLSGSHRSGMLVISIGLVLVIGFIISLAVTPGLLQAIWTGIKWVWGLIMEVITFIAGLFPQDAPAEPAEMTGMTGLEGGGGSEQLFSIPEEWRKGLGMVWILLFLGLITVALWRVSLSVLRWWRRRAATSAGAEFERMPGGFRRELMRLLRAIGARLRRLVKWRPGGKTGAFTPEIASVRQIYLQLIRWASAAGMPRRASQTPYEYLGDLEAGLPQAGGALELVTRQYVRARYGTVAISDDELREMKQSWYNIKQSRRKGRR